MLNVLRRVWRGAWRPTWPLPQGRRWWHHIDYWPRRLRDLFGGLFIFFGPPWLGFLIYERYNANPKAMLALIGIIGVIWLSLVLLAYHAGGEQSDRR
jgi:hypothetical protein